MRRGNGAGGTLASHDLSAGRRGLLAFGFFLCAACANEDADKRAAYTRVATLSPEVTIGAIDGAPEYLFGSILDVLPARDGKVWVLDGSGTIRGPFRLRQFDAEGTFLREVGRPGGGPGEFEHPSALAEISDGRVVLRDASRPDHLLVYSADGSTDTTWSFNPPIDGWTHPPDALFADRDGYLWVSETGAGLVRMNGRWQRTRGVARYYRVNCTGAILDTILAPQLPVLPARQVAVTERLPTGGRSTVGIAVPFEPGYLWAWSPEGYFATGRTDDYRIGLWRVPPAGERHLSVSDWAAADPVQFIGRSLPPVRVSLEERRDLRKQLQQQVDRLPGTPSGPVPDISSVKPFFRSILFGQEGRMWVWVHMPSERIEPVPGDTEESGPAYTWREPLAFDVFESGGVFLGRVVLPPEAYPHPHLLRSRRDWVWCVIVDKSGAQMVRRYRVTWP
jgi:hypothetical protein